MSKEEFEAWKGHRVTELVRKFLEDWENSIRDQWRDGEGWKEENRHFVEILNLLRRLEYEEMEEFYAADEPGSPETGNR